MFPPRKWPRIAAIESLQRFVSQYREALARYRAGDFEGAARAWDRASALRGGVDPNARYNSANALHHAGRLEEAIARYEALLTDEPHPGATHNLPLVREELERRRTMQPPPPPPPSGDGDREDPGDNSQEDGAEDNNPRGGTGEGGQPSENADGDGEEGADAPSEGTPGEGSDGEGDASQAEPNRAGEGSEASNLEPSGPITEGQAHRMLDAVEEGHQQMVVAGDPAGKAW